LERITYAIGLLCSAFSQLLFFVFTNYHTDETGRSWIHFHQEDLRWALILNIVGLFFILLGIIADVREGSGKEMAPPQKSASETQELQKEDSPTSEKLEDLEATEKEEPKDQAPQIWKEEDFE